MTVRRAALGGTGVVALAVALSTGAADALPIGSLVGALGNDYLFVAAFAGLGFALAAAAVVSGRAANLDQASMPDPERPVSAPPPGADLDAEVDSFRLSIPVYGARARRRIRERLRADATELVVRTANCDRETARARVERGEWTDDPVVSRFLGDGSVGVGTRLRAFGRGRAPFGFLIERTVDELVRRTGGERG